MKQFLSVLLCLLILVPVTTGVFATEPAYITDALSRVDEATLTSLNEDAAKLKKDYGIGVFLAYVAGHADDADVSAIIGEEKDYVLLLLGERGTRILVGGKAEEIFAASEDRDRLGYVHDEQDEWADGIGRYLEVAEEYLEDAKPEEPESVETIGTVTTAPSSEAEPEEKEGFHFGFAAPIIAAVIIGIVGIFVRKKKA